MDILLIPGLWLDARSWDPVLPALRAAGHTPRPLTMPGTGVAAPASAGIGMADWVAAVVAEIDAAPGPVVLVGHSAGGNVAWGAADARPDSLARVVFVDAVPPPGDNPVSEFPVVDGVVPFPGWDFFPDEDVYDLDEATRARTASVALSVPARVPADLLRLHDARRHGVPVTLLMGAMGPEEFTTEIAQWGPFAAEFDAITDTEVVRIGSGHWPQFSVPDRLAQLLVAAVDRR